MQQPAKISVICYFLFVSYVCVCALACTLLSIFLFKLDTFMCFGFPKSRLQYVTHIILIIVDVTAFNLSFLSLSGNLISN
jgi:hypothetical protein